MKLKEKYGPWALVAGASEGLGAAFSRRLAAEGMNLVLVARRLAPLQALADELKAAFPIEVECISMDLAGLNAASELNAALEKQEINLMVYNAAIPYIGRFEENDLAHHQQIAQANMVTPMLLSQLLGTKMLQKGKGAIVLMASLAGFQGSGFLTAYASSKAFDMVLGESLWYEWKDRGVDVLACCAGATATPNYINTQPEKISFFAPKVQQPEEVVTECFAYLGKGPSRLTGRGNRIASFFMRKFMSRKMAVNIMGDTTRKMYRL